MKKAKAVEKAKAVSTDYDLYREQVAYLARQTPVTIVVNGSVTIITSVILWNTAPDLWLFIWIMLQLAFSVTNYSLWRRGFRRSQARKEKSEPIRNRTRRRVIPPAIMWGVIGGALWGGTVVFLSDLQSTEQLALIVVLFGLTSGATSSLGAIPQAAASFIIATVLPMVAYFFLHGTLSYSALGIMCIIYAMAMLYATRTVYLSFLEATQNRRANALLLDQIRDERIAAAVTLLHSEERYNDVVETIGDMIVNTDADGKIVFANRSWRTTLGYDDDDLASMNFLDVIDDDHKLRVERITGKIAKSYAPATTEFVFKAKDGRCIWVEANANPMFKDGKLVRINGIFRDINLRKQTERTQQEVQAQLELRVNEATRDLADINASLHQEVSERRQAERAWRNSEEQLRLILDSTVEAIYGVDLSGRCTFANMACAQLLGYEEPAEILGVDMHTLAHGQSGANPADDCPVCLVHRRNGRAYSGDEYFTRKNAAPFPVEYSAGSILRDGMLVGGVVAFLDITRRRVTEDQLRQSQKMEAIGQLTGGIAHDFNNLLAVIVGNLDLLASGHGSETALLDAATKRRTDAALRAAERASDLTHRLLSFSRQTILDPQIINPGAIVEDMSEILRRVLGDQIVFIMHMANPLWETVIDQPQFENVLLNLSINARDAMPGGGRLTIDIANVSLESALRLAHSTVPEGDYIKLTVSDAGNGIPAEILDRVFEPFFTTKGVGHGTGLGLSMVYGFVEQSKGFINIGSDIGCGTQVTIYLPRATSAATHTIANQRIKESGHGARTSVTPDDVCILVVEDDPGVRNSTVAQICGLGYKVLTAEHGVAALELFKATPGINLVYTDIMMPHGMNGLALAEQIKLINPEIKVLFCTGFGGDNFQDLDPSLAASVLQKPVRIGVLAEKLRETLET